ncbi:FISUMP domain-containing protein [Fibrobacter sp.]|uniref:FISUMP domain-containing protein n=1 Tax=Fibrobacter sp. TaxID=35828 RepID=UPI00388D4FC9
MNLFYKSLVGASILSLVACGDDSTSSTSKEGSKKGLPSEVSSSIDLAYYECDEDIEGVSVYVKSAEIDYVCNGDGWFRADDPASEVRYSEINGTSMDPEKTDSTDVTDSEENLEGAENTFIDARDGKSYKTVTIGTQVWMAENLNIDYQVNGVSYGSYCYYNKDANCDTYGRLYTWGAAMDSAGIYSSDGKGCGNENECTPAKRVRGVCPEGWHLPNDKEWDTLLTYAGRDSNKSFASLKASSGWEEKCNGTDSLGFSAKPAGIGDSRYINDPSSAFSEPSVGYEGLTQIAAYWISDIIESAVSNIHFDVEFRSAYNLDGIGYKGKFYALSVRCIKD